LFVLLGRSIAGVDLQSAVHTFEPLFVVGEHLRHPQPGLIVARVLAQSLLEQSLGLRPVPGFEQLGDFG
jgi:hypothetical protein